MLLAFKVTHYQTPAEAGAYNIGRIPRMRKALSIVVFALIATPAFAQNQCSSSTAMSDPAAGTHWNGWGASVSNTRFQTAEQAGLTAAQIPRLKLKWAFGVAGVTQARSQVAVAGGRIFFGSDPAGIVYSLDAKTGCTYWTYTAQAGVRTAISIGRYTAGYAAYFSDVKGNAYAVDANTGRQIWTRKLDEHPAAKGTGAPVLYEGRVYFPLSGVSEETSSSKPDYQCCTFRGSISALDASTGTVIWKTYTVPEPKPRGKSSTGALLWGPAGVSVWSSPTIDAKRGVIYAATGNGYADPPQPTTDAVIALDIKNGKIKWASQAIPKDVWIFGCGGRGQTGPNPNCPDDVGPDFDFSASPILAKLPGGREVLVVPQKSGVSYALDPDKDGAKIWEYRAGKGSAVGGVWGATVDAQQAYFGVSDYLTSQPGGLHAVNLSTGERVWYVPPHKPLCGTGAGCSSAQSAALTSIDGVVFSASADGGVRAYSTKDGSIVWLFDTNRDFETINGVSAKGGSMDAAGPVIAGGMVYVTSGNGGIVGRPGNVILAFGME